MSRHLQLVTETAPIVRAYVVLRTKHVERGTPRIVAELADVGIGVESPYAGADVLRREQMESDPALAEALRAWESKDDALLARDVTAFEMAERRRTAPARRVHPSTSGSQRLVPV